MTKRSRYFTSNLLSQGGCNALYIDKQQKNHSCKIGNLQVSNKIIRKKGFSAKNKIYPKKVLTSTNKDATIQAKLAIFRLSCNPLLFVIIFDHTSVVKQDSAIFRPQPSLLSLSGLSKDYQIWSSPHQMSKSIKDIFPPNVLKDG